MKERYRHYMENIQFRINYVDLYAEYSYRWDKALKMCIALTSSASIGAWAIWQQYSSVWACVIAASQVVAAISAFLPYGNRLKVLAIFMRELKLLYNKIEYNWLKVSTGELNQDEINDLLYKFGEQYIEIENTCLKEELLLDNQRFIRKANKKTDLYFQEFEDSGIKK